MDKKKNTQKQEFGAEGKDKFTRAEFIRDPAKVIRASASRTVAVIGERGEVKMLVSDLFSDDDD